jgi:hypothetical protein
MNEFGPGRLQASSDPGNSLSSSDAMKAVYGLVRRIRMTLTKEMINHDKNRGDPDGLTFLQFSNLMES